MRGVRQLHLAADAAALALITDPQKERIVVNESDGLNASDLARRKDVVRQTRRGLEVPVQIPFVDDVQFHGEQAPPPLRGSAGAPPRR